MALKVGQLELSAPQDIFLNRLNTKFRGYIGGFGSGKTFVGCLDLLIFAGRYPGTVQGYFGTSYSAIRDIFYPTLEEAALMMGFTLVIKTSVKEVDIYRSGFYYGTIICRSMDNPSSIVGFKIARALVDELDTLPRDKAKHAWNKIVARLRLKIDGVINSVGVTTTPEGFLFVHSRFADKPKQSYSMVQASSFENLKNLPDDYIESLYETYEPELADAYVLGKFVNLKSGNVYKNYKKKLHESDEYIKEKEPLYMGCDFNVGKQAVTIYVIRENREGKDKKDEWHAVAEYKDLLDTPHMIEKIKHDYPDHHVTIYPDASGRARKSVDAMQTDIALLEEQGWDVRANKKNPYINDRVQSVNRALSQMYLYVNSKTAPTVSKCLEQQGWDDNGLPDKKSGHDHQNDASGYPIVYEHPIVKPVIEMPIGFEF